MLRILLSLMLMFSLVSPVLAQSVSSNPFSFISTAYAMSPRVLYGGIELDAKTDFTFRATTVANTNAIITVDYGILLVKQ